MAAGGTDGIGNERTVINRERAEGGGSVDEYSRIFSRRRDVGSIIIISDTFEYTSSRGGWIRSRFRPIVARFYYQTYFPSNNRFDSRSKVVKPLSRGVYGAEMLLARTSLLCSPPRRRVHNASGVL